MSYTSPTNNADLFQWHQAQQADGLPLAELLRPKTLEDYIGQEDVLAPGKPLRNLIENKRLASLLIWGPPGVGKTTLARIIANQSNANFIELSAVHSGLKELREALAEAENTKKMYFKDTVVFIDEIHRYSKTQQDALLPQVERGSIYLIGATTENPSFQVIPALTSRTLLVRLGHLSRDQMKALISRGVQELKTVSLDQEAIGFIADYANGDGRSALSLLDIASKCAPNIEGSRIITVRLLEQLAQQNRLHYDRQGDEHYDHASAFQKSLRGSDANAAIYWLAKMIAAGEDPRFIARRLLVTASEDVGNADPQAFLMASAVYDAIERLGLPEARIALTQAVIYIAKAPKSNQAICAIDAALKDIQHQGKSFPVPRHLKDSHYAGAKTYGHGEGYIYSHADPETVQSFLPEPLLGTRYVDE
jgi:putative ATPase